MNLSDTKKIFFIDGFKSTKFIYEDYRLLKKQELKEGDKYLINSEKLGGKPLRVILTNIGSDNLYIFKNIKTNDIYNLVLFKKYGGFYEAGAYVSISEIYWTTAYFRLVEYDTRWAILTRNILNLKTFKDGSSGIPIVLTDKGKIENE